MTKKSTIADPVKSAADAVAAAAKALSEAEQAAAHWREVESRLRESVDPDDAEGRRAIGDAVIAIELADRDIQPARDALAAAEATYARENARAVAARLAADPVMTGEREAEIVAEVAAAFTEAEQVAIRKLVAIRERQAEVCAEAVAAGLPTPPPGYSGPTVFKPINSRGHALMAWPDGQTVILPGMEFRERPKSPSEIVAAVRRSSFGGTQVADPLPGGDEVPTVDGDYARALLSNLYPVSVRPMSEWDELGNELGAWASVREIERIGDGRVHLEATVLTRGLAPLDRYQPRYSEPKRYRDVLVEQVLTTTDRGAGAIVTVDLIAPADYRGPIDIAAVANAATAAIQAVPAERFDDPLARLLDHEDFTLTAAVFPGDDAHTVAIEWRRWRDGHSVREVLPADIVREALTGIPIAGAGVVGGVEIGGDGRHILGFRADSAEAETAELAA